MRGQIRASLEKNSNMRSRRVKHPCAGKKNLSNTLRLAVTKKASARKKGLSEKPIPSDSCVKSIGSSIQKKKKTAPTIFVERHNHVSEKIGKIREN